MATRKLEPPEGAGREPKDTRVGQVAGEATRGRGPHRLNPERREVPATWGGVCSGEYKRATRDGRSERREWQGSAAGPQQEGCYREAGPMEDWSRDVEWEPGRPTPDLEPRGGREAGLAQRERGGWPVPTPS